MARSKQQGNYYLTEAFRILAILIGTVIVLGIIYHMVSYKSSNNQTPPVHSATTNVEGVTDIETGINYIRCPKGIGANNLKDEYLSVGDKDGAIIMYTIAFEDSAKFISESKTALGGSYVYRAENVPEITLESFNPISAGIYMDGVNSPIDNFFGKDALEYASGLALEDGSKYVEYAKNALLDDKQAAPTGEFTDTEFYIRLYSKTFPGLYYEVLFCTDENGVAYLLDMVTDKLVFCPDELTARING